jgi:ribonuclease HI
MTLTALIEAFRILPGNGARISVDVESEQIVHALQNGWPALWKDRGWSKVDGTLVKNRDLWQLLTIEIQHHDVSWQCATGASNERQRVRGRSAAQR